ncbi:MAG: hypothetical protein KDA28_07030, partial [Phycisphaerales bacterium]|nr:hypothetical protein [Phycisphaerales bacterium]
MLILTAALLFQADASAHASRLLDLIDDDARSRAHLRFEDPVRRAWSFLPGARAGLPIGTLSS